MKKGELMDLVLTEFELRNCDTAIPQSVVDQLTDLGISHFGKYVMIYTDKGSKLVDLHERFFLMYQNAEDVLSAARKVMLSSRSKGYCWNTNREDCTDSNMKKEYFDLNYQIKAMINNIKDQK